MNPLDPLELKAFMRNLQEEMPVHTETTAKIKRSFSQGMPKNLMEYSAHVDNKFLNDNLAIIEEMHHRDQKHPIPKWFREYQIKHFAKHGILKADGFFVRDRFFGRMFPREIYYGAGANYHNMGIASVIGNTKVFGSEIQVGGSNQANGTNATGYLFIMNLTNAIAQAWYDRIALSVNTPAGNYHIGCYDDNSNPNNLLVDSGSLAVPSGYTYQAVTEFQAPSTTIWLALTVNNTSLSPHYWSSPTLGRHYKTFTYGSLPNPAGTGYTIDATTAYIMKTTHS
jgi:hypothetical protein